jgi:hypothetical protein
VKLRFKFERILFPLPVSYQLTDVVRRYFTRRSSVENHWEKHSGLDRPGLLGSLGAETGEQARLSKRQGRRGKG